MYKNFFMILFVILLPFMIEATSSLQIISQSDQALNLSFELQNYDLNEVKINGKHYKKIVAQENFLPNQSGAPDLPTYSNFICLPQNARIKMSYNIGKREIYKNILISPAPVIPWENEPGPLVYNENAAIYQQDELYPLQPVKISKKTKIRGIDAVIISISPFQYNPVQRELQLLHDIEIKIDFTGGNKQFGERRLRNPYWDQLFQNIFLNAAVLDNVEYSFSQGRPDGYEYLIISPDDPIFLNWADSIRVFRNEQGIKTGIVTTTEIGSNSAVAIENYINNAYESWDIPPVAILILGDYGTTGNTVAAPIWNGYCASDHIYADVDNNDQEDIILARIAAQNESHLSSMITKFMNYERNPPTNPEFYNHPITALGWQTERWFQICSEAVGGFWNNALDKNQTRINEIYDGNPAIDPWSTATNTNIIMNVFGPDGLDYIPDSPAVLGGWNGGSAVDINNSINNGAFMMLHRDHGGVTGWGEPDYDINDLSGLSNEDPIFVFSINCLTGKYNYGGTCFAEAFHRHEYGALGLIAASEVSYSFVNDTFVWGMFDEMWPDFLPDMGNPPTSSHWIRPAFANAAGKYFLMQSQWPYNTNNKEVTYNLFHHHGDAFSSVYTEMPQQLTVSHSDELVAGLQNFSVSADEGAWIGLSVDGELIAAAQGTGDVTNLNIPPQTPDNVMKVTVTKQNFYRYEGEVQIISLGQYVICDSVHYTEIGGYLDGKLQSLDTLSLDIELKNIGLEPTSGDILSILTTDSDLVEILAGDATTSQIAATDSVLLENAFEIALLQNIPDETMIEFNVINSSGTENWSSTIYLHCNAPELEFSFFSIEALNNDDNILEPGEEGDIDLSFSNIGSGFSHDALVLLTTSDPYITIDGASNITQIAPDETVWTDFPINISVAQNCPLEYFAELEIIIMDVGGLTTQASMQLPIGFFSHNFENGEGEWQHYLLDDDFIDEWHLEDFRNNTFGGNYSMKCGGSGSANYGNFIYAALEMPEIELVENTRIKFFHWMDVGANNNGVTWDGGLIEISVNNGEWEQIAPVGGYPCTTLNLPNSPFIPETEVFAGTFDWQEEEIDLSDYSGTAKLRFVMGSAGLITGEGWYIDDVNIMNYTETQTEIVPEIGTKLLGNYPNPFNPTTTINFSSQQNEKIEINIFNLKGQIVKTFECRVDPENLNSPFTHSFIWDGKDENDRPVGSGVYFYQMKADGKAVASRKMLLLK